MPYKDDMKLWVLEAIDANGGRATLVDVARHIWDAHETEIKAYGDAFYKWQYDMRWAAQNLRNAGILVAASSAPRGIWQRR